MNDAAKNQAWLDGQAVEAQPGQTILQAAHKAGIWIPTLCADERVSAVASCRLCLVKIEGLATPVASCAHAIQPGMKITVADQELEDYRRTILSLMLSEIPAGPCPRCRDLGTCQLHQLAKLYELDQPAAGGGTSGQAPDDDNPFIDRDYSHCIYCYRCTRVCNEIEQAHAIAPAGRGFGTRIAAPFESPLLESPCTFCGQCVQVCPTGALMDRKAANAQDILHAGPEQIEEVRTTCPFCGTGCGLRLRTSQQRVVGVLPDWEAPANRGSLCVKGQYGTDFLHSADRLTRPLIRRNGRLQEASWDEALDLVSGRFRQIRQESGPQAFVFWSSSRSTNESNYLMQKFARAVIGTNAVDNCART